MSFVNKLLRFKEGGLIGAVLATLVGMLLYGGFGLGLIYRSYDYPFGPRPPIQVDDVVIVSMDEESHKELNQPFNEPWDRSLHARLLERLTHEGCRAVVLDIVFSDPGRDSTADDRLARAIREQGKVVMAADAAPVIVPMIGSEAIGQAKRLIYPLDIFKQGAAAVGLDEVAPDPDLIIRRHFHGSADDELPSLSWATASLLGADATKGPEQRLEPRWINYYGKPGTIRKVSFYAALDTNLIPSGFFSNKVVFVGAGLLTVFSGQRKDEYPTPYSRWGGDGSRFMSGVEAQATMFLNLLRGDWLRRASLVTERIFFIGLLGLLFGYGLVQMRPTTAALVALAGSLALIFTAYFLFTRVRFWFPWLIIIVQIFVAMLWSVIFNSIQLYVQKRLFEQSLARHLPPKRIKQFVGHPELLKPGAEKQMLSIMFSDIENFTTFSEGMDSDELARMMNEYFETAISNIHRADGTVVKLIGDAVFAIWNAPEEQTDHRTLVCQAAVLLRDQVVQFTGSRNPVNLRTRIGVHTGLANVGNFGSATRFDYTALGENINLASRLEGLNKLLGTDILITRQTREGASDQIVTRLAGHFRLKGFEKVVAVLELVALADPAEATKAWRETFEQALLEFEHRHFETAEAGFRCTLEMHPNDGPAKFYLRQIAELRLDPPDAAWAGEIEVKEK